MGAYVDWARRRLGVLQDGWLAGPGLRGDMAALRRSLDMPVGADPVAARWSLRGMPGRRGGAWPTRLERASWMGFGLYAHHQRGWRDRPMQVEGVSLADGLVLLGAMGGDGFVAPLGRLLNARGLEEARGPLLRLMGVLSERGVGIDHALLASDLADLAAPALRDRTRSAWGRALR